MSRHQQIKNDDSDFDLGSRFNKLDPHVPIILAGKWNLQRCRSYNWIPNYCLLPVTRNTIPRIRINKQGTADSTGPSIDKLEGTTPNSLKSTKRKSTDSSLEKDHTEDQDKQVKNRVSQAPFKSRKVTGKIKGPTPKPAKPKKRKVTGQSARPDKRTSSKNEKTKAQSDSEERTHVKCPICQKEYIVDRGSNFSSSLYNHQSSCGEAKDIPRAQCPNDGCAVKFFGGRANFNSRQHAKYRCPKRPSDCK